MSLLTVHRAINSRAVEFGETNTGKLVKLYGSIAGGLASIAAVIVPLVAAHVAAVDKLKADHLRFEHEIELRRLEKQVASNTVVAAEAQAAIAYLPAGEWALEKGRVEQEIRAETAVNQKEK